MTGEFEKLSLSPAQLPPASSKAIRFPARPGYGVAGRKCVVRANHFLVAVGERELHHYDVTITPEVTSKKVNRDVINKLVRQFGESHLGKRLPAYDGRKSLYTAGSLPFTGKEFVVNLEENDNRDRSSGPRREREFKIAIKLASKPDLHHLQQFLRSRQMDAPQETIQVLDIVLRASPSEKYVAVGRSFFHPDLGGRGPLGDGIEYWRGYYQSLRATQMGLSLNIDVSARSFYEPILVTEFIAKHLKTNLSRPLSDQDRVKVRKALKGVKVQVSHGNYTRSYKVTGVSNQPASQLMFTLEDNVTQTSVAQYFRDKYSVVLRYTSLPALQAGREAKPIYLPMELCKIAEEQRYSKRLNEGQVAALLKATCERPHKRESNIKQMVNLIDFNGDTFVKDEFGIQVNEELTLVDARVLPSPTLNYHESGQESRVDPRFGAWNMINKKLVNGGRVDFWTCLNFARVRQDFPTEFCRQLIEMCTSKGMVFNPTPIIPINSAHPGQVEKTLFDVHKHSTEKLASLGLKDKHLQLLLIILPDASGQYGKIKRVCETEIGIVSQCCHPSKATKLSKQYFENVALKINVKVGGRNTVLKDAIQRKIPLVSDRPTIIFGADVTHPQPGEDSSPSIAAVVASIDWPEVTKYRGLVSAQPHRQEIIEDLYNLNEDPQRGRVHGGMIRELLRSFYKSTGQKPDRIIFYSRDGVSEGQFSQVLLYEMDAIRKACASLQEGYQPRVTFVVVQKRHHTRLFPADHNKRDQMDKSGNILPGTVVDTKICHPTEFDFYLNSHAGIQGTSRPAHYHVLFDENGFTADALQMLTNNLCYTYARCTRSVSIVPPAYYAHLAAFRARYYIEGQSSDSGSASGSRATMERGAEVPQLPAIKENVKEVMFYC
ncbi:PAZ domain-containing protein/Piwi domain-containing protein/DUF1785 domain-containing protein [Cephalotus follicularis]|uniref:PAZ domain-containing protein/Piwi domain-containing protein/DUF1785 domain-containing protein n=1 Tax=Cephalotus follicularis TaxID=3775 RepID=A0A1Q3CCS4_CEPFO|nr:PAZ domain-containing protein/Piwi domain-containing protein/DUF1785 domain-containing protein [Cephalotus follicularis]